MKNKDTVCAVVVTYNRKDLLLECLEGLLKQTRQIDAIYLIDNASTDGTPEILLDNGYISKLPPKEISEPWEVEIDYNNDILVGSFDDGIELKESKIKNNIKIYYVRMDGNTGGAGGFYEGTKRAYDCGYKWLWLMDDDAEPEKHALEKLAAHFNREGIVALSNTVIKPNNEIALTHRGRVDFSTMFPAIQSPIPVEEYGNDEVEIDTASFVGILINRDAIEKIGFPKKEFFIHNDDIEYCLRLMQIGKLLLISDSVIYHKEGAYIDEERIPFEKLWLKYYGKRNQIWIGRHYATNKIKFYSDIFYFTMKSIGGVLAYDDNKLKRIKFLINQVLDGLGNKFDNSKPKKILYKK